MKVQIEAVHPRELGESETQAWEGLRAQHSGLISPYFSSGFAKIVGIVRPDARVAVVREGNQIVAFMGVQGRSRFAAMGLGAPLSDYQGVVGDPALAVDAAALCRALGVGRIDFATAPADQATFAGAMHGVQPSWVADLRAGRTAFIERMKERRQETVRQQDRKRRKLLREHPEMKFNAVSGEVAHLQALLDWKTEQCRRTGQPLVWATPWVQDTVHRSFASQDPHFGGLLFTLTIGDTLVAAHYLLRSDRALHAWLIGHDAAFEPYSPGVLLTRFLIEWAADEGYQEVDFGFGDYRYKREFAEPLRQVGWGTIGRPSLALAFRTAAYGARRMLERAPVSAVASAPGRVMRRIDVLRGLSTRGPVSALPLKEGAG